MFFTAGDHARTKIFSLPVPETPSASSTDPAFAAEFRTPRVVTSSGTASAIQPLADGRLLYTRSSLTTPNDVFVLHSLDAKPATEQLTRFTANGLQGKSLDTGSDFWFEGAEGKTVHGWLLKPPGFKEGEKKKWPILLMIHGGPEGAWDDGWSNRWNLNSEWSVCWVLTDEAGLIRGTVFAQQGYVVVAINPTGSTGFGQGMCFVLCIVGASSHCCVAFTDAISEDWGGKPFVGERFSCVAKFRAYTQLFHL